jgi:hypothetical protein
MERGVAVTPNRQETTMYRTLIAAAVFAAISLGTTSLSQAQESGFNDVNTLDQYAQQVPGADVQGQPTGDERDAGTIQAQDRFWVWYAPACWSRWVYVGYNWFGRPVYQRYVWCR